jgi:cytosine/adenosine deaminase-related metal-dependent hydrolase
LQKAIKFAKEQGSRLTAHFLESQAEREWLESSSGEFQPFFGALFKQQRSTMGIDEFLSKFDGYPTHFAHCVQAQQSELEKIASQGHSIAHCPRSNRYLGCGRLAIEKLEALEIPFTLATDGLSSNNTLSIFDEMRAALMIHMNRDINQLADKLIQATTKNAGAILDLKVGQLREGYEADFALIELPETPRQESDISLWSILHTQSVRELYISGETIKNKETKCSKQ